MSGEVRVTMQGGPTSVASSAEEDSALAARFRNGDAQALGELYLRHFPSVYQTVGPRAGDPAATEDLAQAAFLRAWEQRERLSDPGKFRPWLLTTARHLAIDHRRQRGRQGTEEVSEHTPSSQPSALATVVAAETPELVWKAVSSMDARQREILHLTVREELSTPEVASVLGVSSAHAAVLIHRSKRALGAAVRTLLVATRARECAGLRRLIPSGRQVLSGAERASVDRHMRRCADCQAAADRLTEPSRLFEALPLLALPPGWETTGLHAVVGRLGAAGAHAGPAHVPWHAVGATATAAAVAGIVAVALLARGHPQTLPGSSPGPLPPARPAVATAGRIVISGDDPDVHAHFGPNAAGAQHVIQAAVRMATGGKSAPRLLLVTDLRDPGGPLYGDPRLGLHDAGYTVDVADYGSGKAGVLDLHTVRFAGYDAVVVASDFGGWLRQEELDILNDRRAEVAAYTATGGGLIAFAEGGAGAVTHTQPSTTHGWFRFLPVIASIVPLAEYEAGVTVTPDGAAAGLLAADEAGNYLHAAFTPPPGATVLVTDASGRPIAFSLTAPAAATSSPLTS